MELKVWVEGIQRIVCGVTETTTCQDVVFALAHATGKIGRFTLMERWRNNERLLAPTDNPLKILMKWGEYSSDVQFILQRSDQANKTQQMVQSQQQIARQIQKKTKESVDQQAAATVALAQISPPSIASADDSANRNMRKNINLDGFPETKEIGIVKGVQQKHSPPVSPKTIHHHARMPSESSTETSSSATMPEYAYVTKKRASPGEFKSADIRNSLDRKINLSHDNLLVDVFNARAASNLDSIKTPVGVSANGALVPPPYRDPPPPRSSPLNYVSSAGAAANVLSAGGGHNNNNLINNNLNVLSDISELNEMLLNSAHYKDLIQLIKFQREKINLQQADLSKFDTEIVFLENRERDQLHQLDALTREINKTDQMFRQGTEQLQTLKYIEEENEIVRQQEKTLKSEITLLRSKLANCETELLQCKNKIRLLMDDIQLEQRVLNRQNDNRQQIERHFITEVERIQSEIDHAMQSADSANKTSEGLKREVAMIENAISEKKRQVEKLVNEMKEVNLKSLAVAPSEEIRHFLEGSQRPGSSRKMVGSPRQLENAVPTSKNPHGVWV